MTEKRKDLQRAQELKMLIQKYDFLYYEKGVSEISDAEYDRLYDEYRALEALYPELKKMDDSPTKRVGAGEKAGSETALPKFTHKSPLLSIDRKSKDLEELKDFYEKCGGDGVEVIIQPKLDGITCNINYENGVLVNAATRGNGYIGDLITDNFVNTQTKYPMFIPNKAAIELRGEAIIPYDFFRENLEDDYSNPRNAVAGIMRQINPKDVLGKGVQVLFYDFGTTEKFVLDNKDSVNVESIKELRFGSVPTLVADSWSQLKSIVESRLNGMIQEIDGFNILVAPKDTKHNVEYPQAMCDGLVIKVNDRKLRDEIGMSEKGPKWAMAYKFKPLQVETVIDHVEWQVGKSGRITPVAVFDKVKLGGVEITKATLNNYEYMNLPYGSADSEHRSQLRIDDTIIVERSNDVIPRIVAIAHHNDFWYTQDCETDRIYEMRRKSFLEPERCPVCGSAARREGPLHFCDNPLCKAKMKGLLEHYASRNAMNIVGLGESVVSHLFDEGFVSEFADLYKLKNHKDKLMEYEGYGEKKIEKLLDAIEGSRTPELHQFIYSLSIPNVGRRMSKDLAARYHTMGELIECTKEELLALESIGDIMADTILRWFADKRNMDMLINLLLEVHPKAVEVAGDKFKGMSFVITGTLANPRSYYQEIIEKNGGKVSGSVSKKTNVVLIGTDAGSKEAKARKFVADGAPIVILDSEDAIMDFLK